MSAPVLRRAAEEGGYFHWCPACEGLHRLPDTWTFDGNLERPSFQPSFHHRRGNGRVCHYVLTAGVLHFQADCTHALAGQSVPLPPIPEGADE